MYRPVVHSYAIDLQAKLRLFFENVNFFYFRIFPVFIRVYIPIAHKKALRKQGQQQVGIMITDVYSTTPVEK